MDNHTKPADLFGDENSGGPPTDTASVPEMTDAETPLPAKKFCPRCGNQMPSTGCDTCRPPATASENRLPPLRRVSLWPVLGLYFCLLASSVVGIIVVLRTGGGAGLVISLTVVEDVIVAAFAIMTWRTVWRSLVTPVSVWWIAAGMGLGFLTFLFATLVLKLETTIFDVQRLHSTTDFVRGGYGLATMILVICILPAVFEEIGFRGIIFPALRPFMSGRDAVIVSAMLFMTLHLELFGLPYLLALGLVAGFLRYRTQSLLPGMALHFTHNLLCVLAGHPWR